MNRVRSKRLTKRPYPHHMLPWLIIAALLSLLLMPVISQAHQSSTAYLSIDTPQHHTTALEYRLAIRDLALLLPIDANQDRNVQWGELTDQADALQQLTQHNLQFRAHGQPCALSLREPLLLDQRAGQTYVLQRLNVTCPQASADQLRYDLLAGVDAGHRLIISQTGAHGRTWLADVGDIVLTSKGPTLTHIIKNYLIEGTHHLLIGADHLLFLLCLLLPAVYRRQAGQWVAVAKPLQALTETVWIASAFTLAHSITLTLAALNVVHLPVRLIESAIAASIALAALNNIYPLFPQRQAWIAFGFGLIHGFGFANVLSDLPLATSERITALLSFNVGIELGQLLCILIFLPLALALRGTTFYRRGMLLGGSALAVVIALIWMTERLFDQHWMYG